jgi:ribose-phosphate pyrophosphokinase
MKAFEIFLGDGGYTKIQYPAGELQVRLNEESIRQVRSADRVSVVARITEMQQLVELCLLWDAVSNLVDSDRTQKYLVLPYLPFARADRRFVDGDCYGLGVFAKIINALDAPVVTLDVHSHKSHEEFRNLVDVAALPLIGEAVTQFAAQQKAKHLTVLFPDAGAGKRYVLPARIGDVHIQVLQCLKKRDPVTGKLKDFQVPEQSEFLSKEGLPSAVLIVDDICDGGGTFIGIADALKDYGLHLGLYVTHGIFAKGLSNLQQRFAAIFTSDSFRNWESVEGLYVLRALPLLLAGDQRVQAAFHS